MELLVKGLGGTDCIHDWSLSRRPCEQVDVLIFLAGGLKPENVAEVVRLIDPFGLKQGSGVRNNGKLDEDNLKRFFQQLKYGKESSVAKALRIWQNL